MLAGVRRMGVQRRQRARRSRDEERGLASTLARAVGVVVLLAGFVACSSTTDSNRPPVAAVDIDPASTTLSVGSSLAFSATVTDPDGQALTDRQIFWASNDTSV